MKNQETITKFLLVHGSEVVRIPTKTARKKEPLKIKLLNPQDKLTFSNEML
jgi:hypothetical protein